MATSSETRIEDKYRHISVSRDLAEAKVEGIAKQMETCPYHDVTVVIDNVEFPCHRFMLSACSDFFHAMFQSGMKEALSRKVDLKGIEPETFRLLLDSMYLSRYILSVKNVSRVWHAAHQLQMRCLLQSIEDFQHSRLEYTDRTFVDIYCDAKLLNSEILMMEAMSNMAIRFDKLRLRDDLLRLDAEDMKILLSHKKLNVFTEDDVIDAIFFWVSDKPRHSNGDMSLKCTGDSSNETLTNGLGTEVSAAKDRSEFLFELLAKSKILLVSATCSQNLLDNKLVQRDPRALALARESARYHLQPARRHDYCPCYGMVRQTTVFTNVVFMISDRFVICRTSDGKWHNMKPQHRTVLDSAFDDLGRLKESVEEDTDEGELSEEEPEVYEEEEYLTFEKTVEDEEKEDDDVEENEEEEEEMKEQYLEPANAAEKVTATQQNCKAVSYENDVYWTGKDGGVFFARKYKAATNSWNTIVAPTIARQDPALVCLDQYLYLIGGVNCVWIERLHVEAEQKSQGSEQWKKYGKMVVPMTNLTATACDDVIVIFGSQTDERWETVVQVFDPRVPSRCTFTKTLMGSAKNLVSFKHGQDTFVLQGSGALWKLSFKRNRLNISHHVKLWDDQALNLAGATVTNNELLVFVYGSLLIPKVKNVSNFEHFRKLRFIESRGGYCFLNTIIRTNLLKA
ncbi:kelch protein 3 [Biomphalaria glabrata]|nr:kelch protein 3 [Biomphalaria glabrata]